MTKTNDLVDFMHSLTKQMSDEYMRIQKRSTEDPGTAGDEGEENWAEILRNWLPADYQVVTKGRLLSEKGNAGPQVDVIVLHPFYPKHLINKKYYLTAGVAAAFECKNTLKSQHIEKAVENSVEIRNLIKIKPSTYRHELYSPIIYGLVAHSHSWNSENSKPLEIIQEKLIDSDLRLVKHPRECLDFICVSDLAVWSTVKLPMQTGVYHVDGKPNFKWLPGPSTAFGLSSKKMFKEGSEPKEKFTPIGTFLGKLYKKLALNDDRLKDFSWYFGQAVGGGASLKWRNWNEDIFSKTAIRDMSINQKKYQNDWMVEGW